MEIYINMYRWIYIPLISKFNTDDIRKNYQVTFCPSYHLAFFFQYFLSNLFWDIYF